jgi:hypothetical protein
MRAGMLLLAAVLLAGCGAQRDDASPSTADSRALSAYGLSAELPSGWSGRILLGVADRPVLHAANFELPATDTDAGEIAREIGGEMYLNIRDLGPGEEGGGLPIDFSPSDFAGEADTRLLEASRDVTVGGELYRVTAVSGRQPVVERSLTEANELLGTLAVRQFEPVTVPALPPDASRIEGYGISMRLPSGWTGEVTRGEVSAAAPGNEIRLRLLERGGTDAPFEERALPLQLSTAEFVAGGTGEAPAVSGRAFIDHGRQFSLWTGADVLPPSAAAVEQANEALATLSVEPGDFYPGSVEPATFSPAEGWDTGTSGPADAQPEGQQTWTFASTVRYLDEPVQFPPTRTLDQLPTDGIIIDVTLFGPDRHGAREAQAPFRMDQATRSDSWEGMPPDLPLFSIAGGVPGQSYDVDISVLFGRPHPSEGQLAAADAELARLNFPDWSSSG